MLEAFESVKKLLLQAVEICLLIYLEPLIVAADFGNQGTYTL
jgi:hypothetical protein